MSFRPLILAIALAVGSTGVLMSNTAHAQTATIANPSGTLLSVSAEGSSQRVPDIAMISTGVVSRAADTASAMRKNAEEMHKVMAALKKAGIAERDIQTSGINLNPQYHHAQDQPPQITGYEARNTLSVKVRDLSKLGRILDTLVAEGANEINGPSFQLDKPDDAYDEARREALEKAQKRAEMYAKTLGLKVRRIVSVDESVGGGLRPPMPMMRSMAVKAESAFADTSLSPGESNLTVNLNLVFELGQ